jgi:molecular chaperone GrpE
VSFEQKVNMETTKTKKAPSEQTDILNDERVLDDRVELEAKRLSNELEIERSARLRLAAEYQNYRRRTEGEKASAADSGKLELLTELLSIVDDLDLARDRSGGSPNSVLDGIEMIHRRFISVLEANGVTPFASEGEIFDPELHESFDVVASDELKSGTVAREMRRGYLWNGKLLRPALVSVAQ